MRSDYRGEISARSKYIAVQASAAVEALPHYRSKSIESGELLNRKELLTAVARKFRVSYRAVERAYYVSEYSFDGFTRLKNGQSTVYDEYKLIHNDKTLIRNIKIESIRAAEATAQASRFIAAISTIDGSCSGLMHLDYRRVSAGLTAENRARFSSKLNAIVKSLKICRRELSKYDEAERTHDQGHQDPSKELGNPPGRPKGSPAKQDETPGGEHEFGRDRGGARR